MTLTRVEFEYSDGTRKYITGEELDKWMRYNAQTAAICDIHGVSPDWHKIKWENGKSRNQSTEG